MSRELEQALRYFPRDIYPAEVLQMDVSLRAKALVNAIEEFVKAEAKGITTSQLRNIYARVKQLEKPNEAQLLRPLLAYTAARNQNASAKIVIALLDDLIQKIENEAQLDSFKTFLEAIVAYHKFHHPKKN